MGHPRRRTGKTGRPPSICDWRICPAGCLTQAVPYAQLTVRRFAADYPDWGTAIVSSIQDSRATPELDELEIHSIEILNSLPDGITVQDRNFNIIYQNDAMRAAFGNCVGMKCHSAYEKRDSRCEGCGISNVFQSGKATLVIRTGINQQNESESWENACFPIHDASGNLVAAAEVCRNVTDRANLEAEVRQRNVELGQVNDQLQKRTAELAETLQNLEREVERRERADLELRHAQKLQAIGQLAAGIAHEINTPLQFVGDNLHFLASEVEGVMKLNASYRATIQRLRALPEADRLIGHVEEVERDVDLPYLQENLAPAFKQANQGVAQISTIVKAMKEFAHTRGETKAAEDINRALSVALTISRAEYRNVADVRMAFGEIPPVVCRLSDINQVFLNLLVNAAHAIADVVGNGETRGLITIRTSREGQSVRIDIGDTGAGIPEGIRDRIFDPFFTTKEVGRGSGQGLALAHSIVVGKHGGSLTFETQEGAGTTFSIRLPIEGSAQLSAATASSAATIQALRANIHDTKSA